MKKLHIFLTTVLFFSIFLLLPTKTYAITCEEVTPRFMDFEDQQAQCIEPYEECVEDPYDYPLGTCGGTCNDLFPGRINWITEVGCIGLEHENIVNGYKNEFSESSAEYLADFCDCINACVTETRVPYDIEERCTPKLEACCERVAGGLNPDYDYSQETTEEDEEEKGYFTISSIKGDGDVEIVRSGEVNEVAIASGGVVNEGDTLLVGYNTTVILARDDGYYLHIDPMSVIFITKAYFQGSLAEVSINLRIGSMTSKVQPKRGLRAKFEIKTPTSTIGVRGTIFTVEYDDETGITNAYAHYHDIYFEDDFEEYTQDISEGDYISYTYDSGATVSKIPSDKKLDEDLFAGYGEPTSSSNGFMSLDSTSSFGWLLILSCFMVLLILGSVVFLIVSKKRGKKKLVTISLITLMVSTIGCILSIVLYFVLSSDTTPDGIEDYSDYDEVETESIDLLENVDGKYSFYAGDITSSLTEVGPDTGYYSYCYPSDSGLGSEYSSCGVDAVEVFCIREVGETLYQEDYVLFEPLVNWEVVGTSDDGYYYILETPNGEMPTELQPITQYIEEVVESFEVK